MAFPLSDAEHATIKARIDGQQELIVSAAIRCDGVIVSVERPGRHGNCINFLWRRGVDQSDQGFLTNRGRFVGREEAAEIVQASGQGSKRDDINGLFSEDMWNDWDVSPRTAINAEDIF